MNTTERLLVKSEIAERVLDYWNEVDTNWGAEAPAYFTEGGIFASHTSDMRLQGRDEIGAFYSWRVSRGARTVRHIIDNLAVDPVSDSAARVRYVMTIWGRDGEGILPVTGPNAISQVEEEHERHAGRWLIRTRWVRGLFKGDTPTTIMPAAELVRARAARSDGAAS